MVEAGDGRFALHVDAFGRQTSDLRVPRHVPIEGSTALPETTRVRNSASRTVGGAVGGAFTFERGYLGLAVDTYDSRYGTVDLLVNSVGTTRFVPHADLAGLEDDLIDEIFRANWRGPFATIRALQSLLSNGDGGVVVNVSSIAGVSGVGSNVAYCASKAALNTMTVSLARALAPAVRVVSISPGLVDTDFIQGLDPDWRREQATRTPLGRLASPEDVSRAVLAVTTMLSYSTGSIITVDGGRLLG